MGNVRVYLVTLKPQYNDPVNNKFTVIKNLISRPFVVNSIREGGAIWDIFGRNQIFPSDLIHLSARFYD
jgi:hypothetical protein